MLTIGEVAGRAGLRTSAVRYYEDVGILPAPERVNGRRRYGPEAVERLEVIRFARAAGLSLEEIRVLFHGFGDDVPPAPRWREVAHRKLRELDEQAERIARMRRVLEATLACGCVTLEDCAREVGEVGESDKGGSRTQRLS
ncbi:MAG TPA: MerR family transcriptional regulator [Longimicrobiales bacterium]